MLLIFKNKPLSLTLFKLGIFLVNNVQAAFPPDDFAVGAALFNRCSNLHNIYFSFVLAALVLLVAEGNPSLCQIIR